MTRGEKGSRKGAAEGSQRVFVTSAHRLIPSASIYSALYSARAVDPLGALFRVCLHIISTWGVSLRYREWNVSWIAVRVSLDRILILSRQLLMGSFFFFYLGKFFLPVRLWRLKEWILSAVVVCGVVPEKRGIAKNCNVGKGHST